MVLGKKPENLKEAHNLCNKTLGCTGSEVYQSINIYWNLGFWTAQQKNVYPVIERLRVKIAMMPQESRKQNWPCSLYPLSITLSLANHGHRRSCACRRGQIVPSSECVMQHFKKMRQAGLEKVCSSTVYISSFCVLLHHNLRLCKWFIKGSADKGSILTKNFLHRFLIVCFFPLQTFCPLLT